MKRDRKRILTIYPKNYHNYLKERDIRFLPPMSILLIVIIIYCLFTLEIDIFLFFFYILSIVPIFLLIYIVIGLYVEPLIIYQTGFIPCETKFKIKLFGRKNIINFNSVEKINDLGSENDWMRINIILKNNKKILQVVNDINEFKMIKETFDKYKTTNI